MNRLYSLSFLSSTSVLLVACATAGTKFNFADIEALTPGVTTETEAISRVGKPYATRMNADGSKQLFWAWVQASPIGASKKSVGALFDKDGRFVRITSKMEAN
jgi:hypothetical protein